MCNILIFIEINVKKITYPEFFSPNQQTQKQSGNLTGQTVNLVQDKKVTKGLGMPMS